MTKILLIGSSGQLGQELALNLPTLGTVVAVCRKELDLTVSAAIATMILDLKPDIIVNAAAYTAVDKAEGELDIAQQINAIAPTIMAQSAEKIGAKFLHVSTDYVFDGAKNTPYLETDSTHPIGVYGSSKRAGEIGIENTSTHYLILRTAWVYGVLGKANFVKTMLRLGKEREQIKVVIDQVGSPTWAKDIADAIGQLLSNFPAVSGVYHFTNNGVISWYDFAQAIFAEAQNLGFPLQVKEVIPITTAEYPTPAQRPAYSVLSTQKITPILGYYPPYWRESLKKMLQQLNTETAV